MATLATYACKSLDWDEAEQSIVAEFALVQGQGLETLHLTVENQGFYLLGELYQIDLTAALPDVVPAKVPQLIPDAVPHAQPHLVPQLEQAPGLTPQAIPYAVPHPVPYLTPSVQAVPQQIPSLQPQPMTLVPPMLQQSVPYLTPPHAYTPQLQAITPPPMLYQGVPTLEPPRIDRTAEVQSIMMQEALTQMQKYAERQQELYDQLNTVFKVKGEKPGAPEEEGAL